MQTEGTKALSPLSATIILKVKTLETLGMLYCQVCRAGGLSHCPSRDLSSLSFFYLFQHPRECFRNQEFSSALCSLRLADAAGEGGSSFSIHAKQQALNK